MKNTAEILIDSSLYVTQNEDLERCAKLMARAFDSDPSIRYLLGGASEGVNDWRYFHTVLNSVFGKALLLSLDKEINELLVLLPPNLKGVPTMAFLCNGGARLPFLFQKGLLKRSLIYESNCKKIKKSFSDKNTWYCMGFVVSPELQKHGRGSLLMKTALNALEDNNFSLYLETHKDTNIAIYEHLRFQLKDISFIPKTDIKQYAMLWKPACCTGV